MGRKSADFAEGSFVCSMKLSYKVTKEQYIDLIAMTMKERTMKPAQTALTAVMCGLPVVLVLFMLFMGMLADVKLMLLSAALLALAAANFGLRTQFHGRAKKELERMMANGRIHKRFFDKQTLVLDEKGVTLSYPGVSSSYLWANYQGMIERKEAYLLYFGGEPAAIVPYDAFTDEEQKKAFLDAIYANMRLAMIEDSREMREDIPQNTFCVLSYSYDLASYMRHQRAARRQALFQRKLWRRWDSLKIIALMFLLASLLLAERPAVRAISALLLVGLLLPYIFVMTPLVDLSVRRALDQVLRFRPGRNVMLYANEEMIKIVGDIHCMDIPWSQVRAAAEIPGGLALYLNAGLPLTIPVGKDIADSERLRMAVMQKFNKK